jgi:uncharacterized protein involved in cysteine biosynthesis
LFGGFTVSEKVEEKEEEEEVVIGEQVSQEYLKKVPASQSAEVKMVLYVVPVAIILITIAYVLSRFTN